MRFTTGLGRNSLPNLQGTRKARPGRPDLGVREAAAVLGVAEQTLHKWAREGRVAKGSNGRYDPLEVLQQVELWELERRASGTPPTEQLLLELAELARVRCQAAELKLGALRANVVGRRDVERAVRAVFDLVRAEVRAQADRLAPACAGAASMDELREIIREDCWAVLERLASAQVVEEDGRS